MRDRKTFSIRHVDKNFTRFLRQGEGEHIGGAIFAAIGVIQTLRKSIAAQNKRKFVLLAKDAILDPLKLNPRSRPARLVF